MQKLKVVYLDSVPPEVEAIVRACLPPELALEVRSTDKTVEDVIVDADFVLVATTSLPREAIAAARQLQLIQHQGVGYDKTDIIAAAEHQIPVALCPMGTTDGVAEHVFLLILALFKSLLLADTSLRKGIWSQWALRPSSFEIAGKTMGILGFGRIGRAVASRARAFKAEVIYHDIERAPAEVEDRLGARFVSFEALLSQSDILTLHTIASPQTYHLIGEAELRCMKSSAILINTARGTIVNEPALIKALQAGLLAGAGLDVFESEPIAPINPLINLPNVVLTPHIAAGTRDALVAKMEACFANMLRVARGERPIDMVTRIKE